MPEVRYPLPFGTGGTKLQPGVGIVLSVGFVATCAGLALWLVTDINGQTALTLALIAAAAAGVYLDRARDAGHNEYMENLRRIDLTKKLK
ncbi:MAG: hypothetical protein ACREC0_05645 [Methylocella sp.]